MTAAAPALPARRSTRDALVFVYIGYAFRYLYLLVLVPFYGRVLGAAEYGRVLSAMALFQFVWLIAEYGFPSLGMRDIATDGTPRRRAEVYGLHTGGRLLTTGLGLTAGAIGTFASPLLRERPLFGLLATLTGATAAFNLGWYFQGILRFGTSVLLEMLGFAVNLATILLFVRGKEDGWIVLASLLGSSILATMAAHFIALRSLDRSCLRWNGGIGLVRESTALFMARSLALLTSSSSTFLIGFFADATQVGYFGAAERLAAAGLSLMQPANQVLTGTVAALIASPSTERRAFHLIRRGLVLLTAMGGVMLFATLALAGVAVPLVLGPDFGPSVRVLRILGLMFPLAAFSQVVTGYVLVPLRLDRLVSVVSVVGAVVTVALTFLLGSAFVGEGVAWARVIGYVGMCAALFHVLRRQGLMGRIAKDDSP
jgi:O-antigen/teichoic acid export membrane protein